ncbi:hypothetical protein [Verrucomicrobium sp. BvORR106]|uniref:hypothetical protein n=1 Tax=Verrucomicrobium sp. BvORR106 TaxID=1403819 RepID=UPI000A692171|nr:hypothetical protein [Verrucomicrobium sp. BvORR106]
MLVETVPPLLIVKLAVRLLEELPTPIPILGLSHFEPAPSTNTETTPEVLPMLVVEIVGRVGTPVLVSTAPERMLRLALPVDPSVIDLLTVMVAPISRFKVP